MNGIIIKSISYILVFILFSMLSCRNRTQFLKWNYQFHDSTYRNLIISFRSDSTFMIRNAVHGSLRFTGFGKWQIIKNGLILSDNVPDAYEQVDIQVLPMGDSINTEKAYYDRRYIFPTLINDTLIFSNNKKRFILKKFHFQKSSKNRYW